MSASPRAVFFDLDDTLTVYPDGFDQVQIDLFASVVRAGADPQFYSVFVRSMWDQTCALWVRMHRGAITGRVVRQERLRWALDRVGLDGAALAPAMTDRWEELALTYGELRPGTMELLQWVRGRAFVGLITDGYADMQRAKLDRFGLLPWLDRVQISEEVGTCKPFAATFELSLQAAGLPADRAIMVGDNANSDIRGALGVGMQAIHLRHEGEVSSPERALVAEDMAGVRAHLEAFLA